MKQKILALLTAQNGGYISGEAMSRTLGVSRAAVWKAIDALRTDGYVIEAAPRRGYRLADGPDRLTPGTILPYLSPAQEDRLICLDSVDSTNNYAKALAMRGGVDGTAVVADEQTGGRGRQGRSFLSPKGKGVYLTMLCRPDVSPISALTLTAFTAVAVCDGIEAACGVRPGIKWTNDIILGKKKLAGILTEMAVEGETGALQYIVIGVGVNALHSPEDFSPELRDIATSLAMELGHPVPRGRLCACIINAMEEMYAVWLNGGGDYRERYRRDCLTRGRLVRVLRGDRVDEALAADIDPYFGLVLEYADGHRETLHSGEVSIRGINGWY